MSGRAQRPGNPALVTTRRFHDEPFHRVRAKPPRKLRPAGARVGEPRRKSVRAHMNIERGLAHIDADENTIAFHGPCLIHALLARATIRDNLESGAGILASNGM